VADKSILCAAEFVIPGVVVCDNRATVVFSIAKPVRFKIMTGPSTAFASCAEHEAGIRHELAQAQGGVPPKRSKV